ncbi:MAG: CotH kinase family protein [Bacteroidota bacterium]
MNRLLSLIFCLLISLSVFTQTSVFYTDSISTVKLTFPQTIDWHHTLDSLKKKRSDDRIDATLFFNGVEYQEVGVRYKGNSSFNAVEKYGDIKFPFNIKINHGHKKIRIPGGYKRLKLANGFRDPSFIREVLAYEIARKYMPASQSNFANVYINDEYHGLYTSSQSVDDAFLEANFGTDKGILFKCDPDWRFKRADYCPDSDRSSLQYLGQDSTCYYGLYELKSNYGWAELIELTQALNNESPNIEELLDIDQTLWMMAFNNVLVNLDSYSGAFCHNYYLYQDTSGVFHPIIWDLNLAFGGFTLLKDDEFLNIEKMQKMSLFTHYNNENRPLFSKLILNDLYRKIYIAHVKTLLEEQFVSGWYEQRADSLQASIAQYVQMDENKLYNDSCFVNNLSNSVDANGTPIVGIKELMEARITYLKDHPLMQRVGPDVEDVNHAVEADQTTIQVTVKEAQNVWLCYRSTHFSNFKRVAMNNLTVEESGDGSSTKWNLQLPNDSISEYYIIAEGEKAVTLSPERASKEFHIIVE